MTDLEHIRTRLTSLKFDLMQRYPISQLAVFGSYARNEQTEESDLDIMVEFNDNIGIQFIDLANELEEKLGIKVDLVSKNGIKDRYFEVIQPDLIYV